MHWLKQGLIYVPEGSSNWAKHSGLTPTPILLDEDTIRVYAGFRDERGVSRIGYVDVDSANPAHIKSVSTEPVLDVGQPGTFDDNGVILGDVIRSGAELWMYYVGFQLVEKVKFLAFTGLAKSSDGGYSFERYSKAPILDRSDSELYFNAIHSIMKEDGVFKAWIGGGSDWEWLDGAPFPKYNIRYVESVDGVNFKGTSTVCIDYSDDEYRIGRPRVMRDGNVYKMFYTKGTRNKEYLPGYAESENGIDWTRLDHQVGIAPSKTGWDSLHLSYPSLITSKGNTYMFYNGNNMGKTGFGYAILEKNT